VSDNGGDAHHLGSHRGAPIPWVRHFGELFVGGIVVFLLAVLLLPRVMSNDGEISTEVIGLHGGLLV
jgi:hypothetical protein